MGSVLASFTNTAGGVSLKGSQSFGPYGKSRYAKGTINTAKGFTGQYNDSLTGLDYYGARYYDAVAGVFLSADTVQGNGSGENPYAYVGGNPETWSDPTGLMAEREQDAGVGLLAPSETGGSNTGPLSDGPNTGPLPALPPEVSVSSDGTTYSYDPSSGRIGVEQDSANGGKSWSSYEPGTDGYRSVFNGMMTAFQDQSGGGPQGPMAVNGAVLASLGFHFGAPSLTIGGFGVSFAPHIGSGGSGGGPPSGPPTAPPPNPNNPRGPGGVVTVYLNRSSSPETCAHIEDAINAGHPSVLTKDSDPLRIRLRRLAALRGYSTKAGFDRDEYPMAMSLEGGAGADIRYVNPLDNQLAGSSIGIQLRSYPNGTQFTIQCI